MSVMTVGKAVPTSSLWFVHPPVPPTQQSTSRFARGGEHLQPCAKGAVGQLCRTGAGRQVQTPVPREAHVRAANTVPWTSASPEGAWPGGGALLMVLLSHREELFMLSMGQNKGRGRASHVHPTHTQWQLLPSRPQHPSTRSSGQ